MVVLNTTLIVGSDSRIVFRRILIVHRRRRNTELDKRVVLDYQRVKHRGSIPRISTIFR